MLASSTLKVELVDVGGGNIGSVRRCLERLDIQYEQVSTAKQLTGNFPLILPGVGSFGAVMQYLRANGLDRRVFDLVRSGTPYLGICVGLQILFEGSEETDGIAGLGLLPGQVVKFRQGKVPQIGWNLVSATPQGKDFFPEQEYVYFVNSYYASPADDQAICLTSDYYETFCAAIHHKNITAFQFHPEKSGKAGERLILRWLDEVMKSC
jgi:imidazole glycerol phosphate synthase glutamine amidotransferase subunit